jgi:sec-independent protein translocase protein TatA
MGAPRHGNISLGAIFLLRLRRQDGVVDTKLKGIGMLEGLFQPMHLLMIFGIALLVFGPRKLPELGKGIGDGIRGFKNAMKEPDDTDKKTSDQG